MAPTVTSLQTVEELQAAAEHLLNWYRNNRRDLPWRRTADPYNIWISEIMLQQTRVDTVVDYYRRFMERFGTLQELARASAQEVLAAWQGLGYYSRALNMHKAAQQVMEQYGGFFPQDYEAVRQLPGIGDYTAGAIVSIAFNQPYPAVDGNVLRVICRMAGSAADISKGRTKKEVAATVGQMIPPGRAGEFTQALMELGALVCVPSAPLCGQCPVRSCCAACRSGRQNELPVKKKQEAPRQVPCWVAVLRENGRILLEHRTSDKLLGQLWGLPIVEKQDICPPAELLEQKYGLRLDNARKLGSVSHVFTHQVWKMEVFAFALLGYTPNSHSLRWVEEAELDRYAVPTAFQRVLQLPDQGRDQPQLP